ncbi:efflux RND transporter periplasmic adaptor subunit [Hyphomonas sp.]|uniref:efflux RND transporter periplasmic adaptor subunit n=1 Tax=Hyphomonas sp. TaxID=87 RepID=UPI0025C4699B|nr:efflux RND transporter periplasmic adaptor subunit [Hyphomonas sp.]
MSEPDFLAIQNQRDFRPSILKGVIFVFTLIVVIAGFLFGAFTLRSAEGPKVAFAEPDPLTVEVAEATLVKDFELEEAFSGLAQAQRTSQLGFSSGGRIESIRVRVGDQVKAGDTLAKLDTRALGAQLASLEAIVDEARASHRLAMDTVERQRTLLVQGHVSTQRVDEAEAQAATAVARIASAKAQADTVRVQMDLARITAPYDGVVTARFADEGAIAGPGSPLLELVEAGRLEAQIGVPASVVAGLVPGNAYTLIAETGPVEATLRGVTGVVNPSQRTVAAVFDITDATSVPAGSIVRLTLPRTIDEGGFWVPLKSLTSATRGLWTVYVAVPDGGGSRAEARVVEMVHTSGERAFVRGPMQPGDRIIIDGLHRITPGVPVTPISSQRASTEHDG